MKVLLALLGLCVAGFLVYSCNESTKAKLLARVNVGPATLEITNGNDAAWGEAEILLSDEVNAPRLYVVGPWQPGEKKVLQLSDFERRTSHQRFKPDFEKPGLIVITVRGYQLGMYQ